MKIDIRKSIINNFKDASEDEFASSISSSIEEHNEITLPGLGVFFEVLWNHSDENSRAYILKTLHNHMK